MCCSTGVCGPTVDPKLVRFSADLEWLKGQGAKVERFNLAQQALAFAGEVEVKAALQAKGEEALPVIKVDGKVQSLGVYPNRDQLAAWAGLDAPEPSIYSEAVQELVAIGAALAANCEPCFKFHFDKARKLGVSRQDMLRAVRTAQHVKEVPAKAVLTVAERFLDEGKKTRSTEPEPTAKAAEGCCGGPGATSDCCG
jgi:AhpD family alkylhydroperoxidase